jgi:hypothetical protein
MVQYGIIVFYSSHCLALAAHRCLKLYVFALAPTHDDTPDAQKDTSATNS